MANQYNSWVSTQAFQLPVDVYAKMGMAAEERAQKYADDLSSTFRQLSSVQPYSKNAETVYDAAMNNLRNSISEVAKMNLNTPMAYQKFVGAINNPDIMKPILGVYQDYLAGIKMDEEAREYLKTNPPDNLTDYFKMKRDIAREDGKIDPKSFNFNRFRNMEPFVKYYEFDDKVLKEVDSLKADKTRLKEIIGDYYYTHEDEGVKEARIREVAQQRVLRDPQARAQFMRSQKYRAYLTAVQDPNGDGSPEYGFKVLADGYRADMKKLIDATEAKRAEALTLVQNTKINDRTNKPYTKKEKEEALALVNSVFNDKIGYLTEKMNNEDDQSLVFNSALKEYANSFDGHAYTKSVREQEWTNMAVAQMRERGANARFYAKLKAMQDAIGNSLQPEPQKEVLNLTQSDPSTKDMGEYFRKRFPEVSHVKLTKEGAIDFEAVGKRRLLSDGRFVADADVFEADQVPKADFVGGKPDPKKWKLVKEAVPPLQAIINPHKAAFKDRAVQVKNYGSRPVYIKANAEVSDDGNYILEQAKKKSADIGKKQLREYAVRSGLAGVYGKDIVAPGSAFRGSVPGFNNNLALTAPGEDGKVWDYQGLVASMLNTKMQNERQLMVGYQSPSWNKPQFQAELRSQLASKTVIDNATGKEVSNDKVSAIINEDWDKGYAGAYEIPYDPDLDGPARLIRIHTKTGLKQYKIASDINSTGYMAPVTGAIRSMMTGDKNISIVGSDLYVNQKLPGGGLGALTVKNGFTAQAQEYFRSQYDKNLEAVKSTGLSEEEARVALSGVSYSIDESLSSNKPYVFRGPKGSVSLNHGVHYDPQSNLYYGTLSTDDKTGQSVKYAGSSVQGIDEFMKEFFNPYLNPSRAPWDMDILQNKRLSTLFYLLGDESDGGKDDDLF